MLLRDDLLSSNEEQRTDEKYFDAREKKKSSLEFLDISKNKIYTLRFVSSILDH